MPTNTQCQSAPATTSAYRIVFEPVTGEWMLRKVNSDGASKVLAAYPTQDAAVADGRRLCGKMAASGHAVTLVAYDDAGKFAFARLYDR